MLYNNCQKSLENPANLNILFNKHKLKIKVELTCNDKGIQKSLHFGILWL